MRCVMAADDKSVSPVAHCASACVVLCVEGVLNGNQIKGLLCLTQVRKKCANRAIQKKNVRFD